jgi:hypothetical protein
MLRDKSLKNSVIVNFCKQWIKAKSAFTCEWVWMCKLKIDSFFTEDSDFERNSWRRKRRWFFFVEATSKSMDTNSIKILKGFYYFSWFYIISQDLRSCACFKFTEETMLQIHRIETLMKWRRESWAKKEKKKTKKITARRTERADTSPRYRPLSSIHLLCFCCSSMTAAVLVPVHKP